MVDIITVQSNIARKMVCLHEFQTAFGAGAYDKPTQIDEKTCLIRIQLAVEELGELIHAIAKGDKVKIIDGLVDIEYVTYGAAWATGIHEYEGNVWMKNCGRSGVSAPQDTVGMINYLLFTVFNFSRCMHRSLKSEPEYADLFAFRDLVDAIGFMWEHTGLSKYREAAFDEVHRSNMSKLDENGNPVKDASGRVVKSARYSPPDLQKVIDTIDAQEATC